MLKVFLILVLTLWTSTATALDNRTIGEGACDYSMLYGGSHAHDVAGCYVVSDFINGLPASYFPTANRVVWTDDNAWDVDFLDTDRDPALSGLPSWLYGWDQLTSDASGTAISMFAGHGVCPYDWGWCPPLNAQCACNTSANCMSGQQCQVPPVGQGVCHANQPAALVFASSSSMNGNYAWYGQAAGTQNIGLGEGPYPYNWAGIGTNGGTNSLIIYSSCGAMPIYYPYQQLPMFGGVHLIASNMVVIGDTTGTYEWGTILATRASNNPNSAINQAWFDGMSQITVGGGPCPGNGGWNGYTGCGANLVQARAHTAAVALSNSNATWSNIRDNATDAFSTAYHYAWYRCNYDCATYPMTK